MNKKDKIQNIMHEEYPVVLPLWACFSLHPGFAVSLPDLLVLCGEPLSLVLLLLPQSDTYAWLEPTHRWIYKLWTPKPEAKGDQFEMDPCAFEQNEDNQIFLFFNIWLFFTLAIAAGVKSSLSMYGWIFTITGSGMLSLSYLNSDSRNLPGSWSKALPGSQ